VIAIYTDGACRGNPGPGGWAALLQYKERELLLQGGELQTTNNRMELQAALEGLRALKRASQVRLTTDSQYVRQGITSWVAGWKRNGWRTPAKKPEKNQDLWEALDEVSARHRIEWCWVRGHSGHEQNERVDAAANEAIDDLLRSVADGAALPLTASSQDPSWQSFSGDAQ